MDAALARHDGLSFTLARHLGFHGRLVDITVERIEEAIAPQAPASAVFAQHPIEAESFRVIGEEADFAGVPAEHVPIITRVIHTTADFEYREILRLSTGAVGAGVAAITSGRNIITDVRMAEAGISLERLRPFGASVHCFSADKDVCALALREGMTKTAAAMRKAAPYMEGGIVAIGNAPTALAEALRLVSTGEARPALVIGVPVGFVGAVEAKDALMRSGREHIATAGRKGGSTVAAAIVNALAIMALEAGASR
ncbi:MAG: precorrin-8X methylmutase [Deltaproteobacteria bacterium]|nr:precorrin-8X methylmutase [Deltaproteobacteria bacterium]